MIGGMKYSMKGVLFELPVFCCAALKKSSYNSACFWPWAISMVLISTALTLFNVL
jgi:hypothetical protein